MEPKLCSGSTWRPTRADGERPSSRANMRIWSLSSRMTWCSGFLSRGVRQSLREHDAPPLDPDQDQAIRPAMPLDDLVPKTDDRSTDLVRVHHRPGGHSGSCCGEAQRLSPNCPRCKATPDALPDPETHRQGCS